MNAEQLLERFWWFRDSGRPFQTLHQDLEIFLTVWQGSVGWQVCSQVYRAAMAREEWDIELGGRSRPMSPQPAPPPRHQGGLIAYG
jgi:hypothetical protein